MIDIGGIEHLCGAGRRPCRIAAVLDRGLSPLLDERRPADRRPPPGVTAPGGGAPIGGGGARGIAGAGRLNVDDCRRGATVGPGVASGPA
jgi:hypothetical protein